jgi:SynChlorMet cassette protein ScmC
MATSNSCKSFSLRLADGEDWEMAACAEAYSWLEKLASILELSSSKLGEGRKLIFVRNFHQTGNDNCELSIELGNSSGNGWKREQIGNINLLSTSKSPHLVCDLGDEGDQDLELNKMWQALYPIYLHAIDSGGLPLHATLVELNGKGFAIAAPGGIGKSTCSRRIPPPWRALCDDEMLVVRDALGKYHAHPFATWKEHLQFRSNRTWNIQYHVPLAGIFFLLHSDDDEAEPLGKGKAATLIYRSASQVFYKNWTKMNLDAINPIRTKTFQNSCKMANVIPAFFLKASLTGSFWRKMEEALKGGACEP